MVLHRLICVVLRCTLYIDDVRVFLPVGICSGLKYKLLLFNDSNFLNTKNKSEFS